MQAITELRVHLFDYIPLNAANGPLHAIDQSGTYHVLDPVHWHAGSPPVMRASARAIPYVPIGPGFLSRILTHHLAHLEYLSIQRSGRILGVEDVEAIGNLKHLRHLEITNQVLIQATFYLTMLGVSNKPN